jgi:neutral ceramidase
VAFRIVPRPEEIRLRPSRFRVSGKRVERFHISRSIAVLLICLLGCFWISIVPAWGAETGALRIGVAKLDITPTDLAGLTNQWATPLVGVHDHIFVRALVLDNGTNTAAIVSADLIEFGDTTELRKRIERDVGIPAGNLIITATHDHSAPRPSFIATAQAGASGPEAFTLNVYEKVVDALELAKSSLQPARMGTGTGKVDVNINRDEYGSQGWKLGVNPGRQSDKTVWVIKFETPSGDPIAVLFNYAVHSVVAGPATDQLTGDLAGAAERYVEQHYKEKVVALFAIGAAGDQNPAFSGPGERPQEDVPPFQAVDAQGLMLGAETVRVANQISEMTDKARIEAAERTISCPAKPMTQGPPPLTHGTQGPPGQQPASVPIHLGLIIVNQIAFTAVSGEVVTNIYWHLKKASPLSDTIMITLSNGRVGYIVDDATYDTPIFELGSSPLARGCAENGSVDNLVEMIDENK